MATQQQIADALRQCAAEPIHRIHKIQPQGILLLADDGLVVRFASDNLLRLLPFTSEEAIGRPLRTLLGDMAIREIEGAQGMGEWRNAALIRFAIPFASAMQVLTAQVSRLDLSWLIEIELPEYGDDGHFHSIFAPVRDALWRLDAEKEIDRYVGLVAEQIRTLSGFDRVMIYRFDAKWDGEVIAESRSHALPSLLGYRFPASDIPEQARRLYTRNLVRLVADTEAAPVAVVPAMDPADPRAPDLTYSALRALSPVHLDYLRNMGVRSSMSISLMQNGRLWGLIACHHCQPRYLSLLAREFNEFIGKTLSIKLSSLETERNNHLTAQLSAFSLSLGRHLHSAADPLAALAGLHGELLGIMHAAGVVVGLGSRLLRLGLTPDEEALRAIVQWVGAGPAPVLVQTDNLVSLNPVAASFASTASGMVWSPLGRPQGGFIAWFRPEILQSVRWAGPAEKDVVADGAGVRLSPRRSFESWVETVRHTAVPWSEADLRSAHMLTAALADALCPDRQADQHISELLKQFPDLIGTINAEGIVVAVSPSSETLFGLGPDRMVGLRLDEVLRPTERSPMRNAILATKRTGRSESVVVQTPASAETASPHWTELVFTRLVREDEAPRIMFTARDVTLRNTYQLALEDLRRRDRIWDRLHQVCILLVEGDDRLISVNAEAARLLGLPCGPLPGQPLGTWVRFTKEGEEGRGRCLLVSADGNVTQAMATWAPLVSRPVATGSAAPPAPLRVLVVRPSAHLPTGEGSEDAAAANGSADSVLVTDSTSRILGVNASFSATTGFLSAEVIGEMPRLLRSGIHTAHFYDEMWGALSRTGNWNGEIWNRRKNGEIYPQIGCISALTLRDSTLLYVGVFSDVSAAAPEVSRLYHDANHDSLTGLPNRARFADHLGRTLERANRATEVVAVAFIDLDRFKSINDSLGHAAGDQYLRTVARRILGQCRAHDMLARWGGDEFLLVLDQLQEGSEALEVGRRILAAVREPLVLQDQELRPGLSIGIAVYPRDGQTADSLIQAADAAMYRVKRAGRNDVAMANTAQGPGAPFVPSGDGEPGHCSACREDARLPFSLSMAFQPIYDRSSRSIFAYEALVRGTSGETAGEILAKVGADTLYAFDQACRRTAITLASRCGLLDRSGAGLSINFLPNAVYRPEVCIRATLALARTLAFPLERIIFEVSEQEQARDPGHLRDIFQEYKRLGFRTAVDDFGAGHNGLRMLVDFQPDILKLDMDLIRGVDSDPVRRAVVRGIVAVCADLNITVLAEGVETPGEVQALEDLGVFLFQGYLFAKPGFECLPDLKTT